MLTNKLNKTIIQEMLDANVHFGHKRRYTNPLMKKVILKLKNDMHIFDLNKSLKSIEIAQQAFKRIFESGGKILFVGTKNSCANLIKEAAIEMNMPYVDKRWLGGTLTNFKEIKKSVKLFNKIKNTNTDNLTKRENVFLEKDINRRNKRFGGISQMQSIPDLIFVVDTKKEKIAIKEANDMGITVIGVVDTNCSDKGVDYPIYGNDDSRKSIAFYISKLKEAIHNPGKE